MLNCVAFRAQLSSVMGVLCQAAVAEVCKLVDEGSARLRTEVRKCRTENQELHRKLRIMEMELRSARQHALPGGASGLGTGAGRVGVGRIGIGGVGPGGATRRSVSVGVQTADPPRTVETGTESCAIAESCPTIEGVFGKEWCLGLWGDGDPPAVELEDTTVGHPSVVMDQLPALIDSHSVKDEMFQKRKWSSDCKESLEISGQSLDNFNNGPGEMPNHGKVVTEEQPTAESAPFECLEQQDIQVVTVGQKELDLQVLPVENMAEPNTHSEDSLPCVLAAEPSGTQQNSAGRGQKYFFCSICGKGFTYLSYFKVHQRRHSGEKPYSCTLCGKSFAQRTYLTLHQRTHTGEKPYCCADCGKCFTQKSSLNSHRRSHTGQKPYSCAECGKKYAYKHGLNLHQCSDRAWKNTS